MRDVVSVMLATYSDRAMRSRRGAGKLEMRRALGEALEPVVRDRLPGRRGGHVRTPAGTDARIAVEGAQAHAHLRRLVGIAAEEGRTAFAAEALLEAAVRMAP